MLVIEIIGKKPLTPAQSQSARLRKQKMVLQRQIADANVRRKQEALLQAQKAAAAATNI